LGPPASSEEGKKKGTGRAISLLDVFLFQALAKIKKGKKKPCRKYWLGEKRRRKGSLFGPVPFLDATPRGKKGGGRREAPPPCSKL